MQLLRKPEWIRTRLPTGAKFYELKDLVKKNNIHTICEEARCPNIGECWGRGTATFLLMGDICMRACRYCNVKTGRPKPLDPNEPQKIAQAAKILGLRYVVLTSVTRDDLPDGGAAHFAQTVTEIKNIDNKVRVELLTPEYHNQIPTILSSKPDVFGHNIETVKRLFPRIRFRPKYEESLAFLKKIKDYAPQQKTKSGIMVGLGETNEEVIETLKDLRKACVDIVTIGQYMQPSQKHALVDRFCTPEEFKFYETEALKLGFLNAFSGPLVRSSYHAEEVAGFEAKSQSVDSGTA